MTDLSQYLPKASASTRARNPDLFPGSATASRAALVSAVLDVAGRRIRQPVDRRSKLEIRFGEFIPTMHPRAGVHVQFPLKVGTGCNYYLDYLTVDFDDKKRLDFRGYEVKGPYSRPLGIAKLKTAAMVYTWITFFLVSEVEGKWVFEKVLP